MWVAEKDLVVVRVDQPDDFPAAFREFTDRYFAEVMKHPGVHLDPRAFLRIRTSATSDSRPRTLCPFSFPVEAWAKLALEQVLQDTSGMQPRYLKNDLSWLEQPAIYTDVVGVVSEARAVAAKWTEEKRKKEDKGT